MEHRRMLARLGLGAAALVVGLSATAPAFAEASGRIDKLDQAGAGHMQVAFSAVGLAPGQSIDLASVKASIEGVEAPVVPTKADAASAPVRRTMLTIDISGSMSTTIPPGQQTRIEAAKAAADVYLKQVPAGVQVGLVTFADQVKVVVPPTTNIQKVRDAVSQLSYTPNGGTALFEAVIQANKALGTDAVSNQLILSDGKNETTNSTATLPSASASIVASKVQVSAVVVGDDPVGIAQLNALTAPKVGNGKTVTAANAATLSAYFQSAATSQANQLILDVTVPQQFAGQTGTLVIQAVAAGQPISASQSALFPEAAASPSDTAIAGPIPYTPPAPGITSKSWFLPVAIGMVAVGLFSLLAIAFAGGGDTQSGRVRRRLSRYSLAPKEKAPAPPTSGALGQSAVARNAAEFAGRITQSRDLDTGLALRLDAAGVPLRPGEWMLIHVGIAIAAGLVFLLISGFGWFATLIGLALGIIGPWLYLSFKEGKRKSRFNEQLPDTLQLMAGSLAAGYSLPQAVDTVVRESDGPMAAELNKALVEARLGVPMEDALETVAVRMDSMDFKWVVMALRIQREVGGNLAEVLTNISATMRERERLRRQVDVLSAEGRLSAIILGALPLLFVGYLVLVRPEYISLLITSPLGILMIIVGVVLLVGGAFWLRKVVKVEV